MLSVLNLLGEGGFSTVHLAKRDENFYALKSMKSGKDEILANFIRELAAYSKLPESKYIPKVEYVREARVKLPYLLMELFPMNLYQAIETHRELFQIEIVRHIFKQILLAVKFLHDNGIVHRDIKLENILIPTSGMHVAICDFGLSRPSGYEISDSSGTKVMGCFESRVSEKNDIFLIASTIINFIFRKIPWDDNKKSVDEFVNTKLKHEILSLYGDENLAEILKRMMGPHDSRPEIEEILSNDFFSGKMMKFSCSFPDFSDRVIKTFTPTKSIKLKDFLPNTILRREIVLPELEDLPKPEAIELCSRSNPSWDNEDLVSTSVFIVSVLYTNKIYKYGTDSKLRRNLIKFIEDVKCKLYSVSTKRVRLS
jgi:serine/threonine protein kinase